MLKRRTGLLFVFVLFVACFDPQNTQKTRGHPQVSSEFSSREKSTHRLPELIKFRMPAGRHENKDRAGLETLGLVHEHECVIILRAKSDGFSNLRYTRIESTSADCSARLACDIDAEEERATQQAGIPGEVENLDQDVP